MAVLGWTGFSHFDRLFRIQRHCHWHGPTTRRALARKLQLALSRAQSPGFLAALAYFTQLMDSRLYLHSSWRKPTRPDETRDQRIDRLRSMWAMARSGLEFRGLGPLPWRGSGRLLDLPLAAWGWI